MEGSYLKRKIRETGVTLKEVSDLLGITSQALNSIFNAKDVRSGTIEKMAHVLNVPVSYFYDESAKRSAVATGNEAIAAINSNISHPTNILEERIKALEALLAEKERLIKAYEKFMEK